MLYESTRGGEKSKSFSEVIKMGIAPDSGLFVPESDVVFSKEMLKDLVNKDYRERAVAILKCFSEDFSEDDFRDCVEKAYNNVKFDNDSITPVCTLSDTLSVMELWHGPTCAFKDMALQILPHFMVKALSKTGEKENLLILVATSGDTGKAALEGFKDVDGTRVCVFFPTQGVSEVQKLQMLTQEGDNLDVVALNGNFDDAQNGVKRLFTDESFILHAKSKGYKLSSANSINWGRLMPQIVYYFSAYCDMVNKGEIELGDKLNFVVPTGNFGNILAGFYARKMGLPINKLICASNSNNVVSDFIRTGVYNRNRAFVKTIAPAMDILISSNVERLLYELSGRDSEMVSELMSSLNTTGEYRINKDIFRKISGVFWTSWASEREIIETISSVWKDFNYVVDTHTAVAMNVYDKYVISTGDITKTVIASTASPFKFNESVARAILGQKNTENKSEFDLLEELSINTGWKIPDALKDLNKKDILHHTLCDKDDMQWTIEKLLDYNN